MTFPREAFTAHGGCACKALRYRVAVPDLDSRAPAPGLLPGMQSDEDVRLPETTVCHCNDCRRASGQLAAYGVLFEKAHVQVSAITRAMAEAADAGVPADDDDDKRNWIPAAALFDDQAGLGDELCVSVYKSSPRRHKAFCPRCGVAIGHVAGKGTVPPEWGWPDTMAVVTATMDREVLEREWWRPERATWTACGIPWVRDAVRGGVAGVVEHPLAFRDKVMGEDIAQQVEMLKALGENINVTIAK
ncbi:glutathione-dependent formaldehyde-activating enzyme domain-containing protein [Purpureocillium lavendulum]|uniref:Glutathione-dependent formaldehyde-activating enzyme domain-containing protein n=1 Tax=Purpureocillium lavendulum TaxID=1247861 RepID=A0AB34FQ58_9HYPO|nr:glutathione-dependent formaldehyde-activating enzyme domain-containing protein [Purpureocillium lavendulum]